MKNIALLGFGTVGKGCAEILKKRKKEIEFPIIRLISVSSFDLETDFSGKSSLT